MKNDDTRNIKILNPKNQLELYGFDDYFHSFVKLFKKNKLPNAILLNGSKGLGKSTFAYHFINFMLSHEQKNKYSLEDFSINYENKGYKSLCDNTNPNFFLLDKGEEEDSIKIELSRNLLKFLNKSTYQNNMKIILIDNAEFLNINAANALLKAIEEPSENTFFFIVSNSNANILDTIKSRCVEFNFFLSIEKKKDIFNKLIKIYSSSIDQYVDDKFFVETPGNILRYLEILDFKIEHLKKNTPDLIIHLIDKYKQKKENMILSFITFLIEMHYNELSFANKSLEMHYNNKFNLLNKMNEVKKFNLDKKNLFTSIEGLFNK